MTKAEYKGFCLFNDIPDYVLRNTNRAKVLANLAEDHTKSKLISPKGAALILGYLQCVPVEERQMVTEKFKSNMKERGFVLSN